MHEALPIPGPLRLGDLLDRAFRLYRARFWVLVLTGAVLLVPLGILSGVLTGRAMRGFLDAVGGLAGPESPPEEAFADFGKILGFYGLQLSLAVLAFLVNGLVTLALTYHAVATLAGRRPSLMEGFSRGSSRFPAFIAMSIVQALLIGVVTVIVLLPLILLLVTVAVSGAMLLEPGSPGETGDLVGNIAMDIFLLCGYLVALGLLFLPALYLSARWIVAVPGLVAQRWGPVEALRRSWALTKGQVLRCAGYLILLWILGFVVVTLPTVPHSATPVRRDGAEGLWLGHRRFFRPGHHWGCAVGPVGCRRRRAVVLRPAGAQGELRPGAAGGAAGGRGRHR
jgi:hypothetical protein